MKKVVIIGRPNVGKSSFINRLLGKKTAITAREEGVTRDTRYYEQTWNGKTFRICDTGGVIFSDNTENPYQSKINEMIAEIRKRKGLSPDPPGASEFIDKE